MPAPKGNKYAVGNKGGSVNAMYQSAEEMQAKIDEYFVETEKEGAKPPSVIRLALHLGFVSRQSLLDYAEKEEFSGTIRKAKSQIEADRVDKLIGKETFTPGLIFDLKNNYGWKDKVEHDHDGSITMQISDKAAKL